MEVKEFLCYNFLGYNQQHSYSRKVTMGHIKKVFFFPDAAKEEVRAELGAFQGTVNYVAMLGTERTTVPYLDAPLDAELAARLLQTLSTPETEYVVVLRNDHQPKAMLEYLQQRQMAFATKQEVLTYPSSVIYLAALGKQVHSKKYFVIFRTRSIEDVRWTISKFGSLDRVRVFITKAEVAAQVADLLAQDSSQIDYGRLL